MQKSSTDTIMFTDIIEEELNKTKISNPKLTKYEKARIIGERAQQIADGSPVFISVGNLTNPGDIALKELELKKIPFYIMRRLPDGTSEYWRLEELH